MLLEMRWAAKSNSTRGCLIFVMASTVIIWPRASLALSKSLALTDWKTTLRMRRARKTLSAQREKKRETLEEVELTLTIDHLPLIDTGWEGEPLVLKMTHHLLRFT